MMASPLAVRWSSFSPAMALRAASRSVVGGTSTVAIPENDSMPRFTPGVRLVANSVAAVCAAASRFGLTSVDSIDSDTSMTSITVALFRGTLVAAVGPASATVSRARPSRTTAVGRCRIFPGRLGATESSSSRLAKRIVCRRVRRCAST